MLLTVCLETTVTLAAAWIGTKQTLIITSVFLKYCQRKDLRHSAPYLSHNTVCYHSSFVRIKLHHHAWLLIIILSHNYSLHLACIILHTLHSFPLLYSINRSLKSWMRCLLQCMVLLHACITTCLCYPRLERLYWSPHHMCNRFSWRCLRCKYFLHHNVDRYTPPQ